MLLPPLPLLALPEGGVFEGGATISGAERLDWLLPPPPDGLRDMGSEVYPPGPESPDWRCVVRGPGCRFVFGNDGRWMEG